LVSVGDTVESKDSRLPVCKTETIVTVALNQPWVPSRPTPLVLDHVLMMVPPNVAMFTSLRFTTLLVPEQLRSLACPHHMSVASPIAAPEFCPPTPTLPAV